MTDNSDHQGVNLSRSTKQEKDGGVSTLAQLYHTQKWLDAQKFEIERNLRAATDTEPVSDNLDTSSEVIVELTKELISVSSDQSIKDLLLRRLQLGIELEKDLFVDQTDDGEGEQTQKSQTLLQLTTKQSELVSQVLSIDKENQQLKAKLTDIQKQSLEIKDTNRDLMSQLQGTGKAEEEKSKQFDHNAKIQSLKELLEEMTAKIVLQRNILQSLVVGSGINWAQDDELRAMVIGLGEPLNI